MKLSPITILMASIFFLVGGASFFVKIEGLNFDDVIGLLAIGVGLCGIAELVNYYRGY